MKKQNNEQTYNLIDSGNGRKLEQFGRFLVSRPSAQAVWRPQLGSDEWQKAEVVFTREGDSKWLKKPDGVESWSITVSGVTFKISPTDFGHLGIFPEQASFWQWMQTAIKSATDSGRKNINVLNLFAYSGGVTLAAAKAGAHVCHLDASKGMVAWARENAALSGLQDAPIRWIVDDVNKFLQRELRRGTRYDAIVLDPPSFGRGSRGEVFKIEDDLPILLKSCRDLLSDHPLFVMFSCHTPGFTPVAMHHLMTQMMEGAGAKGRIDSGEMVLSGAPTVFTLPSGTYARWCDEQLAV